MSLEITIYTKSATKQKLIKELTLHEFQRCKGVFEYSKDEIGFKWFQTKHYESFTGVEATIYKSTQEERDKYNCSEWILRTRTRMTGSYKDKEKQNVIIKHIRKLFGGTFHNDWYGTNTCTNLNDYPNLSAAERGLTLMRQNIRYKIICISRSLDEFPKCITHPNPDDISDKSFKEYIKSTDPSLTIYNAMLPFLVSMIEFMFKESFLIMIKYDDYAQKVIEKDKNIKVTLEDFLNIRHEKTTIENIVADNFTFQNLYHVNKAYKDYLNIDIVKMLSIEQKIGEDVFRPYAKVEEIIQIRHDIIHHFGFHYLDKTIFITYLDIVDTTLRVFMKYLESRNSWSIEEI